MQKVITLILFAFLTSDLPSQTSPRERERSLLSLTSRVRDLRIFHKDYDSVTSDIYYNQIDLDINHGRNFLAVNGSVLKSQKIPCQKVKKFGDVFVVLGVTDVEMDRWQWRIFKRNAILQTSALKKMTAEEKASFLSTQMEAGDVIYVDAMIRE